MKALVIAALLLTVPNVSVSQGLNRNPFEAPIDLDTPRSAVGNSSVNPQAIDLRATLVSPNRSLANVGGEILQPGDEFQGFRLESVAEGHAVFSQNGESFRVAVSAGIDEDRETSGEGDAGE